MFVMHMQEAEPTPNMRHKVREAEPASQETRLSVVQVREAAPAPNMHHEEREAEPAPHVI